MKSYFPTPPTSLSNTKQPEMSQFLTTIDTKWLSAHLGQRVTQFSLDQSDLEKLNKASGLRFATATLEDGRVLPLVLKLAIDLPMSKQYGLAREGLFYQLWASLPCSLPMAADGSASESPLGKVLPNVYHSEGSMETGDKLIVMEDLSQSYVQLGYYYGPGNPNNYGKDLAALTSKLPMDVASATHLAFSAAAKLHAPYWGCHMEHPWLAKAAWLTGKNEDEWTSAQGFTSAAWAKVKAKIASTDPSYTVRWDPFLVACIDSSISKAQVGGWAVFQAELSTRPFTLVHGDFHPANLLTGGREEVLLVDWEAVGLGSGPQELGQFMISHAQPELRASIEKDAVAAYYAELKALNPLIGMTFEQCWNEYIMGGLGRWLFFLPFDGFSDDKQGQKNSQFFADQVLAFIKDHGVTPDSIPMPRV